MIDSKPIFVLSLQAVAETHIANRQRKERNRNRDPNDVLHTGFPPAVTSATLTAMRPTPSRCALSDGISWIFVLYRSGVHRDQFSTPAHRSPSRAISFPRARRALSALPDQGHQDPQQKTLGERAQHEQKMSHSDPPGGGCYVHSIKFEGP